jgi:dienelactone hydrolase
LNDVADVISLSGELELPTSELDAIGAAPKISVPFLFVGSEDDGYVLGSQARRLTRAVGSKDKQVHIFSGAYHGWDLLDVAPYARASSRCCFAGSRSGRGSRRPREHEVAVLRVDPDRVALAEVAFE